MGTRKFGVDEKQKYGLTIIGATLVIEDRLNRQPAHLAAMRNHPGVLEYLYEVGVDLECADEQGRNPLHYAAQYGSLDCLVSLIQRDCDITIGDHHGSLPIHYAASHNRLECVRFLVKQGASLEAVQNEGKLVTHMAAHAGSRKVLHWLLSKGLRADTQDNGGNAPLHYAAEAGKAECFNCLLHHSALLEIRNQKTLTPLEVAKTKGHPVLIDRAINNEVNCCECKTKSDFNKWERSHSRPCVLRSVTELQKVAYSSPLGPVKKEPTRVQKNAKKRQTKSSTAAVQKDNSSTGDSVFLTEKKVDKLPRRDLAAKFLGEYLPSNEKSDTKY